MATTRQGGPVARLETGVQERLIAGVPGQRVLGICVIVLVIAAFFIFLAARSQFHASASGSSHAGLWIAGIVLAVGAGSGLRGLTAVAPGEAVVVQRFGRYVGTLRTAGLYWIVPQAQRRRVSTKVRTYRTIARKVNDAAGNPIEIAAVVLWQVADTVRAVYRTEDLAEFVAAQSEAAVREVAARFPYYDPLGTKASLCSSVDEITDQLTGEVSARVESAGLDIVSVSIVELAYAPEIAQAMLRHQQAGAIVAARKHIVEGAVGMVELALARLESENVVDLDSERKAAMVSNLMVVLCSDHPTQPIVNAGSLY
ncbi:MAG TPA: SPFH domain-containing protein [Candidatus Dormibacteraeota bacterium]|nr:SPFH domain-containing protein [Candidatus Dormibacteraeota bacterium]